MEALLVEAVGGVEALENDGDVLPYQVEAVAHLTKFSLFHIKDLWKKLNTIKFN